MLEAGNNQTLKVDFIPSDNELYNNASKTVSINVLKAKSWVLSERVIQWVEPYKDGTSTFPEDIPWNVSFSFNESGNIASTVYSGEEFNVTRTHSVIYADGRTFSGSKTDTWSRPPSEMIPNQEYTMTIMSTSASNLGNGIAIFAFGSYDEALIGFVPDFFQNAFYWEGEKSVNISLDAPVNNEDALKERVLKVNLSSGAGGPGTENHVNFLYIYKWQ